MLSSQQNLTVTCPSLFLAPNADLQAVEANFALKQMRDTDIFTTVASSCKIAAISCNYLSVSCSEGIEVQVLENNY